MEHDGLECRVGSGRVVVPAHAVEVLGEYDRGGRARFASPYVAGFGIWAESARVVLAVSVVPVEPVARGRSMGVMLATHGSSTRWVLDIRGAIGLVRILDVREAADETPHRPRWLRSANAAGGRGLLWLDVDLMIQSLTGARR